MNFSDLLKKLTKDTDRLLGLGTVTKTQITHNAYGYMYISTEKKAKKVESLLKKSFERLSVRREGVRIMIA